MLNARCSSCGEPFQLPPHAIVDNTKILCEHCDKKLRVRSRTKKVQNTLDLLEIGKVTLDISNLVWGIEAGDLITYGHSNIIVGARSETFPFSRCILLGSDLKATKHLQLLIRDGQGLRIDYQMTIPQWRPTFIAFSKLLRRAGTDWKERGEYDGQREEDEGGS